MWARCIRCSHGATAPELWSPHFCGARPGIQLARRRASRERREDDERRRTMKTELLAMGLLAMAMTGCGVAATDEAAAHAEHLAVNGNGAPSGAHYNLNVIGVPKGKSADMTGNNGHRIFVALQSKTKILLSPGDFGVLD